MQIFHSLSISRGLAKRASFRCMTSVELESISLLKWQSLLQMPWLVVIWTIVTLCSEVCPVSISTNCKVFRTPLLVLLQIIESMLMLHPFYRNSTGGLLGTVAFSNLQHLCINFCIVVLLLISNRSCLLVVVPIVLGIVTQIINTLQFLLSIHQSSSQPNILAIFLPLMLLRSGMTSVKMFAVQHQLPPSERRHVDMVPKVLLCMWKVDAAILMLIPFFIAVTAFLCHLQMIFCWYSLNL